MMNQENLLKKLGLILDELNDQYQFLAQNPQQINALELELFLANVNFLADHIQIIKKVGETESKPILSAPAEETANETINFAVADEQAVVSTSEELTFAEEVTFEAEDEVVLVPETETTEPSFVHIEEEVFKLDNEPSTFEFILNDHAEHEKFDYEEKSIDEIFNRPLSAEEERILAEKMKLRAQLDVEEMPVDDEDEIGPEPFLVHKEEEQVLPIEQGDLALKEMPVANVKINEEEPVEDPTYKPTLNDLLAKSVASNLSNNQPQNITDLKQSINLNDKLLYIKDLFNGYNLAYAEAIELANKLPNFEAADNFFQKNYAVKNNWAAKQATVDKFYELLNRRFK